MLLGCNYIAFGEQKQCNCFAMPNLLQWNASCAECHSFSIKMNTHHNRCFPIFVQIIASYIEACSENTLRTCKFLVQK